MPPRALNLKQRLATLSLASSSPSSSTSSGPKSPSLPTRWRKFNNVAQRGKKQANDDGATTLDEEQQMLDRVQDVIGKMIFQAGVDFETRPMVVFNASALPDPREVSYDLLLSRILSYLNLYVESDYSVVYFAAGSRHTPAWSWIWKAYRSLNRKYRKNLKQLYIVHSSFFSKMLFSLAGAIISPKFFRKLTHINTLSDLAYQVPITQIDIPPAVYQENLKYEDQITLPSPTRSTVFGVPLEDLMGYNGEKGGVPRVVKDCIQYVRETGMDEEGIFRRSPNSVLLKQAKDAYDRGHVVSLETFGDAHLAAVLLKKYLRDLPTPLFPEQLYPVIRRCPPITNVPNDMSSITYIRESVLTEVPPCAYILLSHVLHLLHEMTLHSQSNRMDAHNLAVVLCPNLVASSNPTRDVFMCSVSGGPTPPFLQSQTQPQSLPLPASSTEGQTTLGAVIKLCIQRYYEVFDEVVDRSEALPLRQHDGDEEEDIDDAMLVMPIGMNAAGGSSGSTLQIKHRRIPSGDPTPAAAGGVRPHHGESAGAGGHTVRKARSIISIDNAGPFGSGGTRRGSITVGRGTTSKSSGAGVEAMGVTVAGFFTPPSSAPAHPKGTVDPRAT